MGLLFTAPARGASTLGFSLALFREDTLPPLPSPRFVKSVKKAAWLAISFKISVHLKIGLRLEP